MPRPTKFRRVDFFPENNYFVPMGKPKCELEEIVLKVEELEAMRLKDIEELNQEECAERMQVSSFSIEDTCFILNTTIHCDIHARVHDRNLRNQQEFL